MRRTYAYKIVKGELKFRNNDDEERVLRVMERWRKTINDTPHREWHMAMLPEKLQRSANEFIEQQRKSRETKRVEGEPVLHEWMVQLDRNYARFTDEDFRHVALTTLEPYHTVVGEFRCRRWRLLKEALSSTLREGCKKPRHVLEICNPKLVYGKRDRKICLIYDVRKLVELPELEDLKGLKEFVFLSVDINTSDVAMGVFKYPEMRQLAFHRFSWNYGELERASKVIDHAKSIHGNIPETARTWKTWLRRRMRSIAHEAAHEVLRLAKMYDARAIATEKLSKRFKCNKSKDVNRRLSRWTRGRITKNLGNRAAWDGVPVLLMSSFYNSQMCTRCGTLMEEARPGNHHLMNCRNCGLTDDRDHLAVHNIAWKFHDRLTSPQTETAAGVGLGADPARDSQPTPQGTVETAARSPTSAGVRAPHEECRANVAPKPNRRPRGEARGRKRAENVIN